MLPAASTATATFPPTWPLEESTGLAVSLAQMRLPRLSSFQRNASGCATGVRSKTPGPGSKSTVGLELVEFKPNTPETITLSELSTATEYPTSRACFPPCTATQQLPSLHT